MNIPRVLMVVPTLGTRPAFLRECLASIAGQSIPCHIVLVGPRESSAVQEAAAEFRTRVVPDPGSLAAAINAGVAAAPEGIDYLNWLGDDDLLEPGSLEATVTALERDPTAVVAYGSCRYVDEDGNELWVSSAGKWAPRILTWGPDLIPQPGMLVRRSAWQQVGGLDTAFRFAFDLDLLLKLRQIGGFVDVRRVVSCFRWHADSLTVGDRSMSLHESEVARRRALDPSVARWAWLWEPGVRAATRLAARELQRRARRRRSERHG